MIGIDAGGTKTRLARAAAGTVIVDLEVSSADWEFSDFGRLALHLVELIEASVSDSVQPVAAVVGSRGCESAEHCTQLRERLQMRLPMPVAVVNDAELLIPAAGVESGIGVVAGTGSIAVGYDKDDRMLVAGGWGWLLGDEGSAPALVREAARSVMAAYDRGEPDDCLTEELLRAFDANDVPGLPRAMGGARGAGDWSNHARIIFELAENDRSDRAAQVIRDGGEALARLVDQLAARGADATTIAVSGGVISAQPLLLNAFQSSLSLTQPASVAVVVELPPVYGALTLAAELLNPETNYPAVRRRQATAGHEQPGTPTRVSGGKTAE